MHKSQDYTIIVIHLQATIWTDIRDSATVTTCTNDRKIGGLEQDIANDELVTGAQMDPTTQAPTCDALLVPEACKNESPS